VVYIAGEDSAHINFVRGFLAAMKFPSRKAQPYPWDTEERKRYGDGKARALEEARRFLRNEERQQGSRKSLVVVLHDSDGRDPLSIASTIRSTLTKEFPLFPGQRLVVIVPVTETETWIQEVLGGIRNIRMPRIKQETGDRAFEAGYKIGERCRSGEQRMLPTTMLPFCEVVLNSKRDYLGTR
jgi:hypothetical protein